MKTNQFIILFFLLITIPVLGQQQNGMVKIEGDTYLPLYGTGAEVSVDDFMMDVLPVTKQEYLNFVIENPEWRRSNAIQLFVDDLYLEAWESDTTLGKELNPRSPVTQVSWFAAKEYCECQGKRLPTVEEWEYVAMADETQKDARTDSLYNQQILSWYETPRTYLLSVGQKPANYWGVKDMTGLVWEWTQDFNSVIVSGDYGDEGTGDNNLFCDVGEITTSDMMNYAAFMRYAFRGSMKGKYTSKNQGFRCVSSLPSNTSENNEP